MVAPSRLPVELLSLAEIEPLKDFRLRFDYDKAELRDLAEDIRENEQIQPGRVILRPGKKYGLYIGHRRYEALKMLYAETKDRRFNWFSAFVDRGLSDEKMWKRALGENLKEGRKNLTALELVEAMRRAKFPRNDPRYKRYADLGAALPGEKVAKLHELERVEGAKFSSPEERFRFGLEHLEELVNRAPDTRTLYQMAALVAHFKAPSTKVQETSEHPEVAQKLDSFLKVFPEYATPDSKKVEPSDEDLRRFSETMKRKRTPAAKQTTEPGERGSERKQTEAMSQASHPSTSLGPEGPRKPRALGSGGATPEKTLYGVLVVPCPHCDADVRIQVLKGAVPEVVFLSPTPDKAPQVVDPVATLTAKGACWKCGEMIYALVEPTNSFLKPYPEGPCGVTLSDKEFKMPKPELVYPHQLNWNYDKGILEEVDQDGKVVSRTTVKSDGKARG